MSQVLQRLFVQHQHKCVAFIHGFQILVRLSRDFAHIETQYLH